MAIRFIVLLIAPALAWSASAGSADPDFALPAPEDAPIALMVDLSSGQTLFERDADRRFVPASITKVMTAFLAFELIEEKLLFPHQIVTVSDKMFEEWDRKGSTMFLKHNQRVTVDELLHGITTVSANDGSAVLAEGAAGSVERWVEMMNRKAREIGMNDSHFGTPNGWPDEGRTYVSARDLATLAQQMFVRHPEKYQRYFGHHRFKFNEIEQVNHDPVTGVIPGADGIKTGFTNQAGYGFLGTAQRNGRRLVMVVAASPNGRTRNKASRQFLEWGFRHFDSRRVFPNGTVIGSAAVQEGADLSVGLMAPGPIRVAVPQGALPKVNMAIRYQGPLRAPVSKGEPVAELEITIGDLPPSRVPLLAANDVAEANTLQRLRNGLLGLF